MALANLDVEALKAKVLAAYKVNDPLVTKFREYARKLKDQVKPLRTYSVNAVAFVSTDGGDNRLTFNPSVIELVRVVDSRGTDGALAAVANTTALPELDSGATARQPLPLCPLH